MFWSGEGREVKELDVKFVPNFHKWGHIDYQEVPGVRAEKAEAIVVTAKIRERKHLGHSTEWKTIAGPDGEEYSRSVRVDKGYEWTDSSACITFEIERLTLNRVG